VQKVCLDGTDLEVSRLSFGCASLHHLLTQGQREELVRDALAAGYTHFDTAPMYGEGVAEKTLGKVFQGNRNEISIATKVGLPAGALSSRIPALMYLSKASGKIFSRKVKSSRRDYSVEGVELSLKSSYRRLNTDWVDILFLHEPFLNEVISNDELLTWLDKLKQRGGTRFVGLAGPVESCLTVKKQAPDVFDVLQVEDSLAGKEADQLTALGYFPQFTYGYIRKATAVSSPLSVTEVIQKALERNRLGSVLVSSRSSQRLASMAELASTI
jgi:aryl-alcohol dehydrogenase-like predicted oxidoreductase